MRVKPRLGVSLAALALALATATAIMLLSIERAKILMPGQLGWGTSAILALTVGSILS